MLHTHLPFFQTVLYILRFMQDDLLTSAKKKKEKRNRKLVKQGGTVDDVQVEDILSKLLQG